jgi:hypothetical protein
MKNINTRSTLEDCIKKCSLIKEIPIKYDLPLKNMGIGDVEFITLVILIEKMYEFDLIKHIELNDPTAYTPNEILRIINSFAKEDENK